jgi:parvulin-like peptidyl-prolyl isomerase
LLETFNTELARYEMAQQELGLVPGADGSDYRRLVLDALIEKELLRQSAQVSGISITPQKVDDRLAQLREAAEEHNGFDAWLAANRWTLEAFRNALAGEMMAETMIAQITAEVPYTAEQVRARYIQVDDPALADSLLAQLGQGADFGSLATSYSRDLVTGSAGGDLGFFARSSLLVSEVEEAAFNLAVDEISEVIAVTDPETGQTVYYILQVIERDQARPLSTALRYEMLQQTYDTWLANQLAAATIRITLDE